MELSGLLISVLVMASFIAISTSMSIPAALDQDNDEQLQDVENQALLDKRATWMNTREIENDFVGLVEMALHKLGQENRINPAVLPKGSMEEYQLKQKRGKFQGFCFKKTATGRFLPYVCWKSDRRRK